MALSAENTGAALTGRNPRGRDTLVQIKLRSGVIIDGEHVDAGSVISTGTAFARQLIHAGKAVPFAGEPEKPTTRKKAAKPAE
jgi:hypothetical protein